MREINNTGTILVDRIYENMEQMCSFAELINLPDVDDIETKTLIGKEQIVPVTVGVDCSLRPKIIDKCGLTCNFCHNEGTPIAAAHDKETLLPLPRYKGGRVSVFQESNGVDFIPGQMLPDEDYKHALAVMMAATRSTELHLTGGEPTLHSGLPAMIAAARDVGYKVKMTSNGENGRYHIKDCAEAGLEKINFSIFGTTPEELAAVQHEKYANPKIAQVKLDALHRSIEEAISCGITVDANIVMSEYCHAERVARVIDKYGDKVSIRILNNLDEGDTSIMAIYKFLAELKAEPIELYVEAGTSNARVKYLLPDGMEIYFKQIRRTTLPETCSSCSFNNSSDCAEGYYGTRLYIDTAGNYKVGVCLQRMDLTQSLSDFQSSSLPEEIQTLKESEYEMLTNYYIDRIKG